MLGIKRVCVSGIRMEPDHPSMDPGPPPVPPGCGEGARQATVWWRAISLPGLRRRRPKPLVPPAALPATAPGASADVAPSRTAVRADAILRAADFAGPNSKIHGALHQIMTKLCVQRPGRGMHLVYQQELDEAAGRMKPHALTGEELIDEAVRELRANAAIVRISQAGRVANAQEVGAHFAAVWGMLENYVTVYVLENARQIDAARLPLAPEFRGQLKTIVAPRGEGKGEVAIFMLTRTPPRAAIREISEIIEKQLYGLTCLWAIPEIAARLDMSPALRTYLQFVPARAYCSGPKNSPCKEAVRRINEQLEEGGSLFKSTHRMRVLQAISEREKQEALWHSVAVVAVTYFILKGLGEMWPTFKQLMVAFADDILMLIPNAWKGSRGRKDRPFFERCRAAWPALRGGLIGLGPAFAAGLAATLCMHGSSNALLRGIGTQLFGLSCYLGTAGGTLGDYYDKKKMLRQLIEDARFRGVRIGNVTLAEYFTESEAKKVALVEAILSHPFRAGAIGVGIPIQAGGCFLAPFFGWMNNNAFVYTIAVAESVCGLLASLVYRPVINTLHYRVTLPGIKPAPPPHGEEIGNT